MATISATRHGARYRIAIAGRLRAKDLQRLERACCDALQYERVPLDLNLDKVRSIDAPARTYIDRLRTRGALVQGPQASTGEPGS